MDWLVPQDDDFLSAVRMGIFKTAATDDSFDMDTCRIKFECNPPAVVQVRTTQA